MYNITVKSINPENQGVACYASTGAFQVSAKVKYTLPLLLTLRTIKRHNQKG